MMNFYIRIENDEVSGFPMSEENLRKIIPNFNSDNLPVDLLPVEKTEIVVGVYEVYEGTTYQLQSDKVLEVHNVRNMTEEEISSRQNIVKETWRNTTNFSNWIFSEELCQFVPPTEYPQDGKLYRWNDDSVLWEEVEE